MVVFAKGTLYEVHMKYLRRQATRLLDKGNATTGNEVESEYVYGQKIKVEGDTSQTDDTWYQETRKILAFFDILVLHSNFYNGFRCWQAK